MKKVFALTLALALLLSVLAACGGSEKLEGKYYSEISNPIFEQYYEFHGDTVTVNTGIMSVSVKYSIDGNRLILAESVQGVGLEYTFSEDRSYFSSTVLGVEVKFVKK